MAAIGEAECAKCDWNVFGYRHVVMHSVDLFCIVRGHGDHAYDQQQTYGA